MYQPIDVFSAGGPPPQPYVVSPSSSEQQEIITPPTDRDVLNGRGQGVQRHPGNVKYRLLVHVNKVIYAKCPRNDKIKISKGIVDAVRYLGGRFLELDERSGIYHDIREKKAIEKTSQALREGQVEIRKNIYNMEEGKATGAPPSSKLDSYFKQNDVQPPNVDHGMSPEGYFWYSVQVLQSLHSPEEDDLATSEEASVDTLRAMAKATTVTPTQVSVAYAQAPTPSTAQGNSLEMAMVLDQFPGAIQSQSYVGPSLQAPIGRFTDMSMYRHSFGDGRLTNMSGMSLASIFSINSLRQLIESSRNENFSSEDRATIDSVVKAEIQDLFRMTLPQLEEIENMTEVDLHSHEDREVDLFYKDTDDRVSELRFTDVCRDGSGAPATRLADLPQYMKSSTKSLDSTLSMMSITDNQICGDTAQV